MKRIYLAIAWLLLIATPSMGQTYTLPEYMSEAVNLLPDHTKDSDPETVRTIRTIAVLAGLGDTLEVMGPGRFGLRGKSVDIGDWNLNPLLVAATQKWLSERFEIKNITYDAAALGRIGPMDWYSGRDARRFLGPLSNNGIDAFVVIRRAAGGLQLVAGDDQDVFEVANFQIEIIDSRKWELVGRLPSQIRSRLGNEGSLPVRIASRRLKPGGDLILMPEQLAEVHQDFLRLLSTTLVSTLRAANLGARLPGPDERRLVPLAHEDEPYQAIKRVAVVSSIGSTFNTRRMGFLVNHPNSFDVTDWKLDELVEAKVKSTLSTRLQVKDAQVDRAAFRDARLFDEKGQYNPRFPGLAASEDIDAYLLLVPLPLPVLGQFGDLGVRVASGIGMERHDMLTEKESFVYAHCSLVLLEARTLNLIVRDACVSSPRNSNPWPRVNVDPNLWPAMDMPLSQEQATAFRKITSEILVDVADETLLRMGLTGMTAEYTPPLGMEALAP